MTNESRVQEIVDVVEKYHRLIDEDNTSIAITDCAKEISQLLTPSQVDEKISDIPAGSDSLPFGSSDMVMKPLYHTPKTDSREVLEGFVNYYNKRMENTGFYKVCKLTDILVEEYLKEIK